MELSANRRYTSKLVLEDTTIVFQKTKGERAEKKHTCLPEKVKKLEDPNRAVMLSGWPWDHRSPGWLEVPCHTHLAPYKCLPDSMYNVSPCVVLHCWACESPGESSVLFGGSWIIHCSRGIDVAQEGRETAGMAGRQIEDSDGILIVPQGTLR